MSLSSNPADSFNRQSLASLDTDLLATLNNILSEADSLSALDILERYLGDNTLIELANDLLQGLRSSAFPSISRLGNIQKSSRFSELGLPFSLGSGLGINAGIETNPAFSTLFSWKNSPKQTPKQTLESNSLRSFFPFANQISGTKFAPFSTVATTGQRIDNGNRNGAQELKWLSKTGEGKTVVTYGFANSFGLNGLSTDRAKALFADALGLWASYAPLEFKEVKDPGGGNGIDIFAQSGSIDGQGKTLAYAYFPTVGDMTFDTGESWSETLFLETTVHELGHALGLDHENDTDAIMNSVLANRYAGKDTAFLFPDDINGIRSLYGQGQGSVQRLGGNSSGSTPPLSPPQPPVTAKVNLVENGSFEETSVGNNAYGYFRSIKGWTQISGAGFQVDRRGQSFGKASDGSAWVELDALGQNSTIGQNIDTLTGQPYTLSVDFTSGGRNPSSTQVEVFWEGQRLGTLSGGKKGQWKTYRYEVTGGARSVSTLALRATGISDGMGGFFDNIIVTENGNKALTQAEISLGATHREAAALLADPANADPASAWSAYPEDMGLVAPVETSLWG